MVPYAMEIIVYSLLESIYSSGIYDSSKQLTPVYNYPICRDISLSRCETFYLQVLAYCSLSYDSCVIPIVYLNRCYQFFRVSLNLLLRHQGSFISKQNGLSFINISSYGLYLSLVFILLPFPGLSECDPDLVNNVETRRAPCRSVLLLTIHIGYVTLIARLNNLAKIVDKYIQK